MNHVAIDYETTFTDTRDIRKLGVSAYLRHPETDIYLVSLFGDEVEYVGHPKDAPWHLLEGRPVVAHNAGFDLEVSAELRRRGIAVPEHPEAYCTADMVACAQVKRDLGTATRVLEGVLLNKSIRGKMKNKTWETMTPDFRTLACSYALDDAKASWLLWENHSREFTPFERRLSEHTRLMTSRGIYLDSEQIRRDLEWLLPMLEAARKEIPWYEEIDAKGKEVKLTSPKRLLQECERLGVPAPATTDAKDERFGDWADEYADQAPFVAAIQQWRKVNRFVVWCQSALARSIDGRMRYSLKYCGAPHTRRWSGDAGVNLQNTAKKPLVAREVAAKLGKDDAWLIQNGVDPESTSDMRGHLIPAPGHKFITADLSQIEPRVLAYLAGQHKLLELMRTGMDVYEAQARAMDLYSDPGKLKDVDPGLRQTVKVLNLGLGYGLGEAGLMRSYRRMSGKKMEAAEAVRLVELYRSKNPEIAGTKGGDGYYTGGLWGMLKDVCKKAAWTDGRVNFDLPSGRTLRYWNVRNDREEGLLSVAERGAPPKHCWHGKSTENCLAEGTPVLTDSGWRPIEFVLPSDLLWDGTGWVSHNGVIDKGEQETLKCHGISCTSDHLILSLNGWRKAADACNLAQGMLSSTHAEKALANIKPRGTEIRHCDGAPVVGYGWGTRFLGGQMRLREDVQNAGVRAIEETWTAHSYLRSCLPSLQGPRLESSPNARNVEASSLRRMEVHVGQMRDTDAPSVPQLRSPGYNRMPRVAVFRDFLEGYGAYLPAGTGLGPSRQQLWISTGELQMVYPDREHEEHPESMGEPRSSEGHSGHSESARSEANYSVLPLEARMGLGDGGHKTRVYDILNCGPRHRFTVLGDFPMIVHNCVQATARDAFAPGLLTLEDDGLPVVMHCHDELTCEVPEDRAKEAREHVTRVMSTSPEWAPGLPVMGVAGIYDRYEKD